MSWLQGWNLEISKKGLHGFLNWLTGLYSRYSINHKLQIEQWLLQRSFYHQSFFQWTRFMKAKTWSQQSGLGLKPAHIFDRNAGIVNVCIKVCLVAFSSPLLYWMLEIHVKISNCLFNSREWDEKINKFTSTH